MHLAAAIHEAGHTVVAEVLGRRVAEVWIDSEGNGLCILESSPTVSRHDGDDLPPDEPMAAQEIERLKAHYAAMDEYTLLEITAHHFRGLRTDAEIRNDLIHKAAGRFAQMRVASEVDALRSAAGDLAIERTLAFLFSDRVRNVQLELANARSIARGLVEQHWGAIKLLAIALIERRHLTGDEVRAILREHGALNDAVAA